MKKLILFIGLVCGMAVHAAGPPIGGPISGGTGSGGLSSNTVYNMIVNYNVGTTGGISSATSTNIANYLIGQSNANYIARLNGFGTNTTITNLNASGSISNLSIIKDELGFPWLSHEAGTVTTISGDDSYINFNYGNSEIELICNSLLIPFLDNSTTRLVGAGDGAGEGRVSALPYIYSGGVLNGNGYGFTNLVTSRIVAGSNITITTNSPNTISETITIASSGGASSSLWGSNSVTGNLTNSGLGVRVIGRNGFGATNNTIADGQFITWSTNGVLTNNGSVGVSGNVTVGMAAVVGTNSVWPTNQFQVAVPTKSNALAVDTNGNTYANGNIISTGEIKTTYGGTWSLAANNTYARFRDLYLIPSGSGNTSKFQFSDNSVLNNATVSASNFVAAGSVAATNGLLGDSLQLFNRTTVPTNAIGTGGSNITLVNIGTNLFGIRTNTTAAGSYITNKFLTTIGNGTASYDHYPALVNVGDSTFGILNTNGNAGILVSNLPAGASDVRINRANGLTANAIFGDNSISIGSDNIYFFPSSADEINTAPTGYWLAHPTGGGTIVGNSAEPLQVKGTGIGDGVAVVNSGVVTTLPVTWTTGSGSPEGVVTAAGGSLYSDTTGYKLYVKETASGNTGWVIK